MSESYQQPTHIKEKQSMFSNVSPKFTFLFGLTLGVAAIATISTIMLLTGAFGLPSSSASASSGTAANDTSSVPAAAPAGADSPTQPVGKVKPVGKDDHVRGAKNPKVYLVEYSDLECPFCKSFHPTMQQALKEYGDQVAWVYRHFPLSFHANAPKEAEASECVNELGGNDKFWAFVDKIFERTTSNGTGFALTALGPLAKEVGVDQTKFQSCLDSGKYATHVNQDESDGTAAGVNGTPATFVVKQDGSSQLISGALPYSQVKQAIDQMLK